MTWEKAFEEWFVHAHNPLLGGDLSVRLMQEGKDFIRSVIKEEEEDRVLHVAPMTDPPMTEETLDGCREAVQRGHAHRWPSIGLFLSMIDWQKSVIAMMARDNGYQEGYDLGYEKGWDEAERAFVGKNGCD